MLPRVIGSIVGALAGIILGQLIVWWGLNKDPFEIAPKVSEYIPKVVPVHIAKGKQNGKHERKISGHR